MSKLEQYLDQQRDRFEEDLCEFLRIPSVSADSRHRGDVRKAAQWVADQLAVLQIEPEIIENAEGRPIVYGETPAVEGAPTALVYGHYDVQPPEPLEEWISPPFEPTKRDGDIFARGATDDKGQMLTHIKSAQAWMQSQGPLPLQLKYVIEGEEEVGSENLYQFLNQQKKKLSCDVVVVSDTSQFAAGQPAITYGLKGITYFELRLTGPRQDLHSGVFGGAVSNPANALCKMLSALIDENGRVQIPGFYDDVQPLSERERDQFAALPYDERSLMEQIGVSALTGERGYSTLERRWARPTFDICGMWSGYQGEGAKTIIPARAGAKFSFRLVPDQDPTNIAQQLRTTLEELLPPGIEMELFEEHGAPGVAFSLDSPYMTAAAHAIERGFGRSPVFIREGGSIPIVNAFREELGADTLLLGWGLDDDNLHSPNEKFCLADYHRGIRASAHLWRELGKIRRFA